MNRPIRFYVWHSAKKEWVHGPGPLGGVNILGETIMFGEWCRVSIEELNDLVVLQFTGLKDSKGREIYEGDLVRLNDGIVCRIEWRGAGFMARWSDYTLASCWFQGGAPEVVGNIFQNPELEWVPKPL